MEGGQRVRYGPSRRIARDFNLTSCSVCSGVNSYTCTLPIFPFNYDRAAFVHTVSYLEAATVKYPFLLRTTIPHNHSSQTHKLGGETDSPVRHPGELLTLPWDSRLPLSAWDRGRASVLKFEISRGPGRPAEWTGSIPTSGTCFGLRRGDSRRCMQRQRHENDSTR